MIEILNESNFNDKVLNGKGLIMVELFATWCPHCQRMAPIVDEFAENEEGKVTVYRVDVDKSPELAQTYAPNGFPTFALFLHGIEIGSLTGEQSMQALDSLVRAA